MNKCPKLQQKIKMNWQMGKLMRAKKGRDSTRAEMRAKINMRRQMRNPIRATRKGTQTGKCLGRVRADT